MCRWNEEFDLLHCWGCRYCNVVPVGYDDLHGVCVFGVPDKDIPGVVTTVLDSPGSLPPLVPGRFDGECE